MKKIVNGKLYDTGEALTVCSWRETGSLFGLEIVAQFTLCREKVAVKPSEGLTLGSWGGVSDLDVKKDASKGEFFLAVQADGMYDSKGRIRPLCIEEARRIFEEHADSDFGLEDAYERYFGVRPQKPILVQLREAFQAGAEAKRKQYEKEESERKQREEAANKG